MTLTSAANAAKRLAHSVMAKSGSVGLELLYHGMPAVVVYQLWGIESAALRERVAEPGACDRAAEVRIASAFPDFPGWGMT